MSETSRIAMLDTLLHGAKRWADLAPLHNVTNPDPPWKTSLSATCESLAKTGALSSLERRLAEDELAETVYREVPGPEGQLLALAHVLLSRGLVAEEELDRRMKAVRVRLEH